jgi:hypothetical protein
MITRKRFEEHLLLDGRHLDACFLEVSNHAAVIMKLVVGDIQHLPDLLTELAPFADAGKSL